jgi:hypothetical protein
MERRPHYLGLRLRHPVAARLLGAALVVVLLSAAVASGLTTLGPTYPAGADPIGSCTATSGVIVVVDFTPWGGAIQRGCDATLTTGYDALYAAGFTTAGDAHDGPEFICRIDDKPTPAQDPCIQTPPATAYWSYWHADAGQDTWSYSELGAATYQPQPGSVDAWTFGGTDLGGTDGQPPFPPSAVRATTTSIAGSGPGTTTARPPAAAAAGSGRNGRSAQGRGSTSAPRAVQNHKASSGFLPEVSTTVPPTTTEPTTTAPPTTEAPADTGTSPGVASAPRIVDAAPASASKPGAGSPFPTILGAAVVATLAIAAAVVAWRRRRIG